MSDTRRQSFTRPSRRRPIHRSNSESSFLQSSDVPPNSLNTQDYNSSPDVSTEEQVGDASVADDDFFKKLYTPEKADISERGSVYDEDSKHGFEQISMKNGNENEESCDERKSEQRNQNLTHYLNISGVAVAVIILISFIINYCSTAQSTQTIDIETIKQNFPTQNEELWLTFESGVRDVVKMEKPSTFIFLYEEEAKDTLANLTNQLSKYATCDITDCSKEPIELTDKELNSPEVIGNYGLLIEKYKNELEDRGVMVIKNLENVYGASAQVFHTFCDEFTPFVQKSLYMFTMKVEQLPKENKRMQFVEEFFKNKWTDVNSDTLHALITRITSMVLIVH